METGCSALGFILASPSVRIRPRCSRPALRRKESEQKCCVAEVSRLRAWLELNKTQTISLKELPFLRKATASGFRRPRFWGVLNNSTVLRRSIACPVSKPEVSMRGRYACLCLVGFCGCYCFFLQGLAYNMNKFISARSNKRAASSTTHSLHCNNLYIR